MEWIRNINLQETALDNLVKDYLVIEHQNIGERVSRIILNCLCTCKSMLDVDFLRCDVMSTKSTPK